MVLLVLIKYALNVIKIQDVKLASSKILQNVWLVIKKIFTIMVVVLLNALKRLILMEKHAKTVLMIAAHVLMDSPALNVFLLNSLKMENVLNHVEMDILFYLLNVNPVKLMLVKIVLLELIYVMNVLLLKFYSTDIVYHHALKEHGNSQDFVSHAYQTVNHVIMDKLVTNVLIH